MRVAVADTSPLHYLVLTNTIGLLPRLFDKVIVPEIVRAELLHEEAPELVRVWAAVPPRWFTILPAPMDPGDNLAILDASERAAIALSATLHPDLILMDDRDGVAAARARGFAVTGTLGLFERAARQGLIELETAFDTLRSTTFYARRDLYDGLLARDRNRHGAS